MAPERILPLHSRTTGWLAALVVAAAGAALTLPRPAPLAEPAVCPGLSDLAAVIMSRTWPDAALGTIVSTANAAALLFALLMLGLVLYRATSSAILTIAAGIAAATSPLFQPVLAPGAAIVFGLAGAAWLAHIDASGTPPASRGRRLVRTTALLALASAAAPSLAVPLAIVAGWSVWTGRSGRTAGAKGLAAVMAAAFAIGLPLLVLAAMPPVQSHPAALSAGAIGCVWPEVPDVGRVLVDARGALAATPMAIALAALGLVAARRTRRDPPVMIMLMSLASIWAAGSDDGSTRVLAPAALAFWTLTAGGLAEIRRALDFSAPRRVGAAALAVALVGLQVLQMPKAILPASLAPLGHDRMSRNSFAALVGAMPADSVLVAEDALTDLLIRALPGRVRESRRLRVIASDRAAVVAALSNDQAGIAVPGAGLRVFALPRAQGRLQHLGLRLSDAGDRRIAGLAEVREGLSCTAPLAEEWRDVLVPADHLALVAADDGSIGPVLLYLASDAPLSPRAVEWPEGTMRGFHPRAYDLADPTQQRTLADEMTAYGAGGIAGWIAGGHVTRIEMWRVPGAPLILPVALASAPHRARARLTGTEADQRLSLCPWYPYEVTPIGPR